MKIKGLIEQDFVQYRKPCMFIIMPYCSFKCEKQCGVKCCQNSQLVNTKIVDVPVQTIVDRYINNGITHSIVFGGLQPFDSFQDLLSCVDAFRQKTQDDIVIYTGYYKNQLYDKLPKLFGYKNIIIKYGRYVPGQQKHYDDTLGVYLTNKQQYAERIFQ